MKAGAWGGIPTEVEIDERSQDWLGDRLCTGFGIGLDEVLPLALYSIGESLIPIGNFEIIHS